MSNQTGQYTIEDEIDGVKISSTLFQPLEIYRLTPRVVRLFVPVLQLQEGFKRIAPILMKALHGKEGISTDDAMAALKKIDLAELQPVISAMMEGLSLPDNARLPAELLQRTQLMERDDSGSMKVKQLTSEADINDAFRGRPSLMLKAMWFAAVFNFGSFFRGGRPSAPTNNSVKATTIG